MVLDKDNHKSTHNVVQTIFVFGIWTNITIITTSAECIGCLGAWTK